MSDAYRRPPTLQRKCVTGHEQNANSFNIIDAKSFRLLDFKIVFSCLIELDQYGRRYPHTIHTVWLRQRFSTVQRRLPSVRTRFWLVNRSREFFGTLRGSPKTGSFATFYLVCCGNSSLVEKETFVLTRLGCVLFAFNAWVCSHVTWILGKKLISFSCYYFSLVTE